MRIAILVHECDDFEGSGYLAPHIARAWNAMGIETVVLRGPHHQANADVCFVHVDLTRVPEDYMRLVRQFPRAINGRGTDISKRVVSRNLVARGDGYDGPVIVKTNRNCGGIKEAELARQSNILRRTCRSIHRRLPWPVRNEIPGKRYYIFDSPRKVPWPVWRNPALVVEKFRPQMQDGFYFLNTWIFCGDRETLTLRKATDPVVAVWSIVERKFVEPNIPDAVRARRRELGLDFGKFDYTIDATGEPVVFDANRTPTNVSLALDVYIKQAEYLAPGLESLLSPSNPQVPGEPQFAGHG